MPIPLTAGDLARFEGASRAMLSVLHADVDTWRAAVTRTLCDLFSADDALFALPGEIDCFASDEPPPEPLNAYRHFFEAPLPHGTSPAGGAASVYFLRRQPRTAPEAAVADHLQESPLKDTAFYDQVRRLRTRHDVLTLYAPVRRSDHFTEALVAVLYHHAPPHTDTRSLSLMRALLPSFQAGLEIYLRQHAHSSRYPDLPTPEALRTQYGLTRREAEVAVLLAHGLSNDDLAARLFISPHTARHHTENVLAKLALSSRKALAFKLLHDVRPPA